MIDDLLDVGDLFKTLGWVAAALVSAWLGVTYFPKVLPIIGYQTERDFGFVGAILPTHGLQYAYLREGDQVFIEYDTNIASEILGTRLRFIHLEYPLPTSLFYSFRDREDYESHKESFVGVSSGIREFTVEETGMYRIKMSGQSSTIKLSSNRTNEYTLKWWIE